MALERQGLAKRNWFFIYDQLARNKENKLVTDVILDFSKAFSTVCHTKLLFKLQKLGIRSSFFIMDRRVSK